MTPALPLGHEPFGHELEAEWLEAERLSRVVRLFETALYRALFRGHSKKRHLHALFYSEFLRSPLKWSCRNHCSLSLVPRLPLPEEIRT